MAIANNIIDREFNKFDECNGNTVVNVKVCDAPPVQVEASLAPGLPAGYTSLSEFNSITATPNGSLTDVVTYTVPVGKKLILDKIETSGDNIARYQIDIGGSIEGVNRTYWGNFNSLFNYDRFEIAAGIIIKAQVEQTGRPDTGDYEARIIGVLGPA